MKKNHIHTVRLQIREHLEKTYPANEAQTIEHLIQEFIEENDDEIQLQVAENILQQVIEGTPVQYITGRTWFSDFEINVNSSVLIPRPETDELVHWILQQEDKKVEHKVWDIGTGSGCIALALKKHAPKWKIFASDISQKTLQCARTNGKRLHLDIDWLQHDIFSDEMPMDTPVDILVSNPPYILQKEKEEMDAHVLREPHQALFVPEDDALIFYKRIEESAKKILAPQGKIYFEVHSTFALDTKIMMEERGWSTVLRRDMQGNWRMLYCSR